jgi:hypothetical protein
MIKKKNESVLKQVYACGSVIEFKLENRRNKTTSVCMVPVN